VKSAYNCTAVDLFSFAGMFLVILVLGVEDPRDREGFPIKTGLLSIRDLFKTGFSVTLLL
jgi:hypothetical protein